MGGLSRRWQAWWQARHPRRASWTLTQRNVYILPTAAGWLYSLLLAALLLGSVNYQLNLGHLLTFTLASAGLVAMHATHATLRGLTLSWVGGVEDVAGSLLARSHAGESIALRLRLTDGERPGFFTRWLSLGRHGIGLRWHEADVQVSDGATPTVVARLNWVDVPAGGQTEADLLWTPTRRGRHPVPMLVIETRFPLGLLRAWSVWRPAGSIVVWPAPEPDAPWPPPAMRSAGDPEELPEEAPALPRHHDAQPEPDGARRWRRGDRPSQVLWRLSAQALARRGDEEVSSDEAYLLVRDLRTPPDPLQASLTLHWSATAGTDLSAADTEARLSRLCAWVWQADQRGHAHTLDLPGIEIPPGHGPAHRDACLDALAIWGLW